MGMLDHEQLRIVLLDTKNRVQDIVTLYVGSLNTAVIRVGEVFKDALRRNMAAIVIVHNHPSGDPMPSPEDVRVTEKIVQAGELLNIDVLDHLVIGHGRYVSLKERGLGF
jgi:DNA repair protein RadC